MSFFNPQMMQNMLGAGGGTTQKMIDELQTQLSRATDFNERQQIMQRIQQLQMQLQQEQGGGGGVQSAGSMSQTSTGPAGNYGFSNRGGGPGAGGFDPFGDNFRRRFAQDKFSRFGR